MEVLRTAILDRVWRSKNQAFSPLSVIQQMYPQDWEFFVEDILQEMMVMYREGEIEVILHSLKVPKDHLPTGEEEILGKS